MSPHQMESMVRNGAHHNTFLSQLESLQGERASPEHIRVLAALSEDPALTWDQHMALIRLVGELCPAPFVDYLIRMLTYAPWGADPRKYFGTREDPFATSVWAGNALHNAPSLTSTQFARIQQIPACFPFREELIQDMLALVR